MNIDQLIVQVEALNIPEDDPRREKMKTALINAQSRLESPKDVVMKLFPQHLEMALLRVGVELGLFKHLVEKQNQDVSLEDLASKTGVSPGFLVRILRFLSSTKVVEESGLGQYRANNKTHIMAGEIAEAAIIQIFDIHGPPTQCLPQFLLETNYQEINNPTSTPFQKGFNTDLACFDWLSQRSQLFGSMQTLMTAFQSSDWLQNFETLDTIITSYLDEAPSNTNGNQRPLFVDVGGGHGHQCRSLLKKYPALSSRKGSIVLQDLPQSLDGVDVNNLEVMSHDFFTAQPVKGAQIYYLRRIMHDWPNQSCIDILSHLAASMSSDSMIMIDEVILPVTKVPWFAAAADMAMMTVFGAKERDVKEWGALAGAVNLTSKL
ncbi:hypothetical protein FE257_001242 [Aspergillus nanangensis]|uniref:O-methyltransferase domain-containing protein n=1 Tax=Aspergillus nanangensis TaxID=2582783 RepID=A0AAD4CE72_ASPNN|nr:hypothetical protein FE257_001242 [Aspergillus nanangensis]